MKIRRFGKSGMLMIFLVLGGGPCFSGTAEKQLAAAVPLLAVSTKAAAPAAAAPVPGRDIHNFLYDYAGAVSAADAAAIRGIFNKYEAETGIEPALVVINSVREAAGKEMSLEDFSAGLFNKWKIGGRKGNYGILLLVAIRDRQCRIDMGPGISGKYDEVIKKIIGERMIPYFKAGDFSSGILEGALGVAENIRGTVPWYSLFKRELLAAAAAAALLACIAWFLLEHSRKKILPAGQSPGDNPR